MSVEERIRQVRPSKRVLSIQSHVVSGYAGNKCSIFPLQLHGFEVDFINSVQFSNHTGYEHIRGQRLTEKELDELYEGLKLNNITQYSHILTGYCGNPTFLQKIVEIVIDLKSINNNLLFVCDPVLGDNGSYYTPKELMPIYRDLVLPLADVITPNAFELSELSGQSITNEQDCLQAMTTLHEKCPNLSVIVVTSGIVAPEKDSIFCYASCKSTTNGHMQRLRFTIPIIRGHFVGTGDVFASLLIVWLTELEGNLKPAVSNVIASLQALLRRTSAAVYGDSKEERKMTAGEKELKLIQSRFDLLMPEAEIVCEQL